MAGSGVARSGKVEESRGGAGDRIEIVFDVGKVDFLDPTVVWRAIVEQRLEGD